jgi:TRAP-type C4-dicarboxylate transport system permease small subunit
MNSEAVAAGALQEPRKALNTRIADTLALAVEAVACSLLVATVVVALLQVFCRYILNSALSWPEEAA